MHSANTLEQAIQLAENYDTVFRKLNATGYSSNPKQQQLIDKANYKCKGKCKDKQK